jgi:hypothetical protein
MFFRRRDNGTDSQAEILREELNSVSEAARSGDWEAARRALRLRHQIGLAELGQPAEDLGYVEPAAASLGGDGLPEVQASELTAGLVRGAILDRGCLLVRGLLEEERAGQIATGIDTALETRDAIARGESAESGDFEPLEADPRYELEERYWVNSAGGLWTADSPFLAADVYGLFGDLGLTRLAREYMKETPVLSVQKGTLRKVTRDNDVVRSIVGKGAGGSWHQDGKFLGSVKALNVWISLSRCGDVSPGMDLVPRRLEEIVVTGTEGAPLDWTVAQDVAREVAGDRGVVRPIFNPGDALMFDEMFLHTTAIEETMSEPRYAIETWFFGSSAFPPEYAPIAL